MERASATNPGTWTRFETAQGIGAASVGYAFALEDPYTGVDLAIASTATFTPTRGGLSMSFAPTPN